MENRTPKYTRENCKDMLDVGIAIANEIDALNETLSWTLSVEGDGERSIARTLECLDGRFENQSGKSLVEDIANTLTE